MATIADSLLVAWTDAQAWAQGSLDEIDDDTDAATNALMHAQDLCELYLGGRRLFVHKYTVEWEKHDRVTVAGESYEAMWARAWPIVEVDTANVVIYTRDTEARRIYATTIPDNDVVFYAGYKRQGQIISGDLDQMTLPTNLSALATLPLDCPQHIHNCICEVATLLIGQNTLGHIHQNQVEQSIGQADTRSVRLPTDEVDRIMAKHLKAERPVGVRF